MDSRRTVSIIIPVLNEYDNILPIYGALQELSALLHEYDWEFMFIDDGSTDASFARIGGICEADHRVKAVQLSRNYGSHAAATAGLQLARGDAAVVMAADLQDHPREIAKLVAKWQEGFEIVWGVRSTRDDPYLSRLTSRAFATLIRRVALPNYPATGAGSFCLMDRLVIDAFNSFSERNRSIGALVLFSGFRQAQISYDRLRRHSGRSKYSLLKKLKLAADIIIAFSVLPLRIASLGGLVIALFSFGFGIYEILYRVLYGTRVPGFTLLAVLVLFLGGLQLTVLGVLGEYLWRTLDDVRRRPLFFVQQTRGDLSGYRPPLPLTLINASPQVAGELGGL